MTDDEQSILDDLIERESGLTGGALDFIDNLDQNYRDRELSEDQSTWLQDLARKLL